MYHGSPRNAAVTSTHQTDASDVRGTFGYVGPLMWPPSSVTVPWLGSLIAGRSARLLILGQECGGRPFGVGGPLGEAAPGGRPLAPLGVRDDDLAGVQPAQPLVGGLTPLSSCGSTTSAVGRVTRKPPSAWSRTSLPSRAAVASSCLPSTPSVSSINRPRSGMTKKRRPPRRRGRAFRRRGGPLKDQAPQRRRDVVVACFLPHRLDAADLRGGLDAATLACLSGASPCRRAGSGLQDLLLDAVGGDPLGEIDEEIRHCSKESG